MLNDRINDILGILQTVNAMSGKWIIIIVVALFIYENTNFYKLKKSLNPITSKLLSNNLKRLENLGIVARDVIINSPLRVEYYLTEKGILLAKTLTDVFDLKIYNKKI